MILSFCLRDSVSITLLVMLVMEGLERFRLLQHGGTPQRP
jgi:hypothetical protein